MNRRNFLISGGVLTLRLFLTKKAQAIKNEFSPRFLSLSNENTGESLTCEYFDGINYVPQELKKSNVLFRNFRRNESIEIDVKLFDYLHKITEMLEIKKTITLLSGYRAPLTNDMLRTHVRGVAKQSFHTRGQAMDFRISGVDLKHLHKAALSIGAGGVGYYQKSNFLHIDTGPLRHW